jgi:hypothetical protein
MLVATIKSTYPIVGLNRSNSSCAPKYSSICGTLGEVDQRFQHKCLRVAVRLAVAILILLTSHAFAWNIPGHMLSGAIAYQILEKPTTISDVRENKGFDPSAY